MNEWYDDDDDAHTNDHHSICNVYPVFHNLHMMCDVRLLIAIRSSNCHPIVLSALSIMPMDHDNVCSISILGIQHQAWPCREQMRHGNVKHDFHLVELDARHPSYLGKQTDMTWTTKG